MNAGKLMLKAALIAGLIAGWIPWKSHADETSANLSISKFVSNMKIGGDMRLRQENFWKSTAGQVDRSRQRFRFRLGIENTLQDVKMVFRMASGTGEQTSTNQSFDNLSGQKAIWIDQAYLQWKAFEWAGLSGGKMQNPFWRTYASDILWDEDVNPEGFAEQFEYKLHERLTAFANFAQMVLDEDAGDNRDQWMYGYQIGAKPKILEENFWTVAGSFYHFAHENLNNFGAASNNEGNTRKAVGAATDVLSASFTIVHLTQEFATKAGPWPFKVQADYVKNIESNGPLGAASFEQAGYQFGGILGKAGAAQTWELAYFFKWLETNATLADIADADFGDGGTNRRGHIFWAAFAPRDYIQLKAKMLVTEVIRPSLAPGPDNINRMQMDLIVKF